MDEQIIMHGGTTAEWEDGFLRALEAETPPLGEMFEVLDRLRSLGAGEAERLAGLSELLKDVLVQQGDAAGMLELLRRRCAWQADSPELKNACEKDAAAVLKNRMGKAFVQNAGFRQKDVAAEECVRRLDLLLRLREDAFCHDRTWGFGVVRRLDDFYEKVTIDFRGKPGHQMSFAYAAETLELVDENHLLAMHHASPAELAERVRSAPDEVVRIALRSYGPMTAPVLQERLCGEIVSSEEWKTFWETARRALREDPLVDLPARRNEPIRLLAKEKAYDEEWFRAVAGENDPEELLKRLLEAEGAGVAKSAAGEHREILLGRLRFALHGCAGRLPALLARFLLLADRIWPDAGRDETYASALNSLYDVESFTPAMWGLPVKDQDTVIRLLVGAGAERAEQMFLGAISRIPVTALEAVTACLERDGKHQALVERLRDALSERDAAAAILSWGARNVDRLRAWALVDANTFMNQVVDALGRTAAYEELKAKKLLLEYVARPDWLHAMLEQMDARQRHMLVSRIRLARGWDEAERRSMMARMIKLYPELEAAAAGDAARKVQEKSARITSWRSLAERQAALKKLVEETIPENSREIGVARSYGDLRENFEYQAARDRQRLLLQREAELKRDLEEVKGTDFSRMPADRAGMGTCVTVEFEGGQRQRYCILGEWDRDEQLGIIANGSKVAESLAGNQQGDEVLLPGKDGEVRCRIVELSGITDEIARWIAGG